MSASSTILSSSSDMISLFEFFWVSNLIKWRSVRRSSIARVGGVSAHLIASHPAVVGFNPAISLVILTFTF
jgi:hypothetical protein